MNRHPCLIALGIILTNISLSVQAAGGEESKENGLPTKVLKTEKSREAKKYSLCFL